MLSHCRACGNSFLGLSVFDMHRTGDYERAIYQLAPDGTPTKKVTGKVASTRRCMTEAEMLAIGMKKNDHGHWTSGKPVSESLRARDTDQDQPAAEEGIA